MSFVGVFIHRTPHLLVMDPKIIKEILVTDFKTFYINEDVSFVCFVTFYLISSASLSYKISFQIKLQFSYIKVDIDTDPLYFRNPFAMQGPEWKEKRADITPALTISRVNEPIRRSFNPHSCYALQSPDASIVPNCGSNML